MQFVVHTLKSLGLLSLIFSRFACGSLSSSNDSAATETTISGTAAIGLAIADSTVNIVDSTRTSLVSITNGLGKFSVTVDNDPPFMLETSFNGETYYFVSLEGGVTNITPMTNLVVYEAFKDGDDYQDFETLFETFATTRASLTEESLQTAQSILNANLLDS